MAVLLACGESGLLEAASGMRRHPCPLACVSLICPFAGGLCAIDNQARLLWDGRRLTQVDASIEAVLPWRGHHLLLSGDTDCITLLDGATGHPVTLAPAGVYPRDMCLLPGTDVAAVCGGADGCIRLMTLPALHTLHCIRVPGAAACVAFTHGCLYALCTVEDDGLKSLLCRIPLNSDRYEPMLTLPGMACALCQDDQGRLWAATAETLYHITPAGARIRQEIHGFGLISSLSCCSGCVLICDAAYDRCLLLDRCGLKPLREGDVQHAVLLGGA